MSVAACSRTVVQKFLPALPVLLSIAVSITGVLEAQSVSISPGYTTVGVGQTVQYTATVTGLKNTSVTWMVSGVKGGNSTVGTITSSGLYTAPAVVPTLSCLVEALASDGKTLGEVYVNIAPAGPPITSISPDPLDVGTITVTVKGTGFQSGALLYDSYGSNSMIQIGPSSVTATTITASIYQGAAATSTFCVKNPGSLCGKSLTVPVSTSSSGGSGGGGSGGGSGSSSYTLTVVNGKVTNPTGQNAYAAGSAITLAANAPPSGEAFADWTGATVANRDASATTLTMPAANTTVTANFYTPAPVPFPVTTHPRLWITVQDLPRIRGWANTGNVAYRGLSAVLSQAVANYNLAFPGAALTDAHPAPANPYPDFGDTQGYTGMISEENAVILAFNSLIDPDANKRIAYAQAAHNLLMYAMNQAALGQAAGMPFRDPAFPIYNRTSESGHEWPLIVDWIYNATNAAGNPILTAADKATIQRVFMTWASDCLTASTTGGDNPGTPGLVNSLALLPNNLPYRMASNNYYLAHARLLTMMSLALDPADDPPVNPAVPAATIGNTLRSYILDATGAWLYQEFAMMGDPQVVAQAYGIPGNPTGAGFGLARGGLPPEGTLYGESFAYVLSQLLALQTAGFNSPTLSGPQIRLIGAPVWDRFVTGYLSSLTPTPHVPASETYIGSIYQIAGYGDMLRLWETPDQMAPFALLGLLEQETGVSTHLSAARWFATDVMPNGAGGLLSRMTDPWSWGVTQDLLYYLLLDPAAPAATDPRPSFPTLFYDPPAGRIVAHSDWSATNTMFDYRASWISINHQDGASGQFGLYRRGEWLTKEMSNYDNGGGGNGATTVFHNSLALENWCPACATMDWQGPDLPAWKNGSQWMEGEDAGDPTTTMSSGPGYVYAASNLTNLYNRPDIWLSQDSVTNITQATRSILWIDSDYIVVYDRATSLNTGLFKRFNLSLVANPAVHGNTVRDTLPSGQQLFVQTLLPHNPSITSFNGAATLNPIADLEPTQYILQVQDPSNPLNARFLHVLQGADPGATMAPATYLQSTSGPAFDGAAFGATVVYFPVSDNGVSGGFTLPAPAGVTTMFVTGLTPGAGYSFSVQTSAAGKTVVITASGSGSLADVAGVLKIAL